MQEKTDNLQQEKIDSLQKEIGQKLKGLRTSRKYTTAEVAERTGITQSYVSKIERGEKQTSITTLQLLADFYNVHISYFFGEQQDIPEELQGKIDWISFGEEMERRNLTPEELKEIADFAERIRSVKPKPVENLKAKDPKNIDLKPEPVEPINNKNISRKS